MERGRIGRRARIDADRGAAAECIGTAESHERPRPAANLIRTANHFGFRLATPWWQAPASPMWVAKIGAELIPYDRI